LAVRVVVDSDALDRLDLPRFKKPARMCWATGGKPVHYKFVIIDGASSGRAA
jgi:hypothetical protein